MVTMDVLGGFVGGIGAAALTGLAARVLQGNKNNAAEHYPAAPGTPPGPNLPPAPPVADIIQATMDTALAFRDKLLAFVNGIILNKAPLIAVASERNPRIRARSTLEYQGMTKVEFANEVVRVWDKARVNGAIFLGKADFTVARAIKRLRDRLRRVVRHIKDEDTLWVGRMIHAFEVIASPLRASKITINRIHPSPTKVSDTHFEQGNMGSDTKWSLDYFSIIKALAMYYGCDSAQANYVAVSSLIDVLSINYGINAGTGLVSAEDIGFDTPVSLPADPIIP